MNKKHLKLIKSKLVNISNSLDGHTLEKEQYNELVVELQNLTKKFINIRADIIKSL